MLPTLLKNFGEFYKIYFPVINHQNKTYVRKFAAESFSHILRRVRKENLSTIINKECLKPFRKPQKYIPLAKSSLDQSVLDDKCLTNVENKYSSSIRQDTDKSGIKHNEIFEQEFCIYEKQLNQDLNKIQVKNLSKDITYKFSFDEKQNLITVISNLFVETIYGVQKKLYTEWKTIVNVMIDNIKYTHNKPDHVYNILLLRYTVIKLIPRLETNALHELYSYIIKNLGDGMISNIQHEEISEQSGTS